MSEETSTNPGTGTEEGTNPGTGTEEGTNPGTGTGTATSTSTNASVIIPAAMTAEAKKARRDELIELTRMYLEEWTRGERTDFWLETNSENRSFYPIVEYIDQNLDTAANAILAALPGHRLQQVKKEIPLSGVHWSNGIGYIPMPQDFIKLEGIRMSSWTRNVDEVCKPGEDEYKIQQNRHARGISDKPKVGLAYGEIELYSCKPTDQICYAYYIPHMEAECIDPALFPLIAVQTAITVEEIFGDATKVQMLGGLLQGLMTTTSV